jgi:hypothetical protein
VKRRRREKCLVLIPFTKDWLSEEVSKGWLSEEASKGAMPRRQLASTLVSPLFQSFNVLNLANLVILIFKSRHCHGQGFGVRERKQIYQSVDVVSPLCLKFLLVRLVVLSWIGCWSTSGVLVS